MSDQLFEVAYFEQNRGTSMHVSKPGNIIFVAEMSELRGY